MHALYANDLDRLLAARGNQRPIAGLVEQGLENFSTTQLVIGDEDRKRINSRCRRHTFPTRRTTTDSTEATGTTAGRRHLHPELTIGLQTVYRAATAR